MCGKQVDSGQQKQQQEQQRASSTGQGADSAFDAMVKRRPGQPGKAQPEPQSQPLPLPQTKR